ncbi:hypothetical protein DAPPUDRAFT_113752 [Daphnia pulex]|uniref:Uncharacterized protein n=1 Tax=Daphnia pulex TaxID=6669 RepID=E9HFZ5_DAPPU|nr:hypothetical protein DAPPUDRAFT_113752 [Daphnia pulex]|eukprot:EFX69302.1 hypothetical protein DAPPUDRAFT_113752 [Daphnia pulex]
MPRLHEGGNQDDNNIQENCGKLKSYCQLMREKKDDSNSDENEADVDDVVLPTPKRKRNVQPKKDRKRAAKAVKRAKNEEANEAPSHAEEQTSTSYSKEMSKLSKLFNDHFSCSEYLFKRLHNSLYKIVKTGSNISTCPK